MLARIMNGVSVGLRRLLVPPLPMHECTNGFKVRRFLKLRCRFCYFIRINGQMQVLCHKHPRHKQMEPIDPKLLW